MSEELLRKAIDMRNAIDMIEGALMGLGDFVDLPDLFEGTAEHVKLAPQMTVGEVRRVCTALAECTRIINSDEFAPDELRRHAQGAPDSDRPYCSPIEQGKAFYLAMYEHEGANWDANENQDVWVKLARDYERRRRAALTSSKDDDCSCGGGNTSGHDTSCPYYAVTSTDDGSKP